MTRVWTDLARVRELTISQGNPDPQPFFNALSWMGRYGPQRGFEIIDHRWSSLRERSGGYAVGVDDVDERETEAYCLEANLRFMHSTGDMLAQSVNASLGLGMSDAACSPTRVKAGLQEGDEHCDVVAALTRFETHPDWLYLDSFVATVKHRKIIFPKSWSVRSDDNGLRMGSKYPPFDFSPRGILAEPRRHNERDREDIRMMVEPLLERVDDVLAAVLSVLEQRQPSSSPLT